VYIKNGQWQSFSGNVSRDLI